MSNELEDVAHRTKRAAAPQGRHAVAEAGHGRASRGRRASCRSRSPTGIVDQDRGRTSCQVVRADDSRANRAKHGLMRALLANMVKGVTEGWTRRARDQRHRLPRRGRRATPSTSRSATRTRSRSSCRRASPPRSTRTASSLTGADQRSDRADGRQDPRAPPARAVQGQGRQVRRRSDQAEGRQGRRHQRQRK